MRTNAILALGLVLLAQPAFADFSVIDTRTAAMTAIEDDSTNAAPRAAAPVHFRQAVGFGRQVPLSFAVLQIVPPRVTVIYGPGAGRDAIVSWHGGDSWARVLAAAVKPLGLRLIMTTMKVEIQK